MNERLQARVDKIQREIDKREALSTSERQARYLTGRGRSEDVAEDRDDTREPERTWGEEPAESRELDADRTSRRQAHAITRGRS